ncbi:non-ribosomal peptide synthetase [Methylorubrum zatmanii]
MNEAQGRETLRMIWQETMRLADRPAETDGYFALGGDSMSALRIIERVRSEVGAEIDFGTFLSCSDFAAFCKAVSLAPRIEPAFEAASQLAEPDTPFPLTEVQRAYWLGRTGLFELGGVAAHGYVELATASLDIERLEAALDRTIRRHPMLRATIGNDGLHRVHAEPPPYRIARSDLRELNAEARAAALDAIRGEMACQVLPSDRWPLFDIRYASLTEQTGRLHVSFDVLILDLASLERWIREWAHVYAEPGAASAPPALTFRECQAALDGLRAGPLGERARAYWAARLETLPACPELPLATDPARIVVPRFSRRSRDLPPALWQSLQAKAAAAGVTAASALLTAYAETLARWSRSRHFTLNLTLFNRPPIAGVEDVLGDFTALTLLEADLRGPATFAQRARSLQVQLWSDLEHRLVSGVEVIGQIAERRRAGRRALMPVVFTSGIGVGSLYDAFARFGSVVHAVTQTPQVWLDHQVMEREGGLTLIWDAVEDLFPTGLLDDAFEAYTDLVWQLAHPDSAAWEQPVAAPLPAGQSAMRAAVNATHRALPAGLLHGPFLDRARAAPDAVAVIAAERTITYGELDRASDRLAQSLTASGARTGELVAVCLPRGWQQVVAVLGILRAGAAYLPLDASWPAERIALVLAQGEARIAIAAEAAPGIGAVRTLCVDDAWLAPWSSGERPGLPAPARPDDLAYVIFTSGSTGAPKGVMIEHRAALNTILDINSRFDIGPRDCVLALSALSFDLSVYDIFGLLAAGGAIVVPDFQAPEPDAWCRLIVDHGVSVWNTVPSLLRLLVDRAAEQDNSLSLTPLRLVMTSGDWLPLPLAEKLLRVPGERHLVSLGGATEAAIWSIAQPVRAIEPDWTSVPYGRPLANQRWHVLDERFDPRPDWVPGELFIAGEGLARGYWRDPERSRARFPVHPVTKERLYRTGDIGRYRPDGAIEFLGREDGQVKVNGLRIELGEIETVLGRDPAIRAAAAVVVRSARHGDRLVAFLVAADAPIDAAALRRRLLERLPAALVPVSFFEILALPLGSNAKVDRAALAVDAARRETADPDEIHLPSSAIERRIAALWEEILESAPQGVGRSFFEVGGSSLAATRLAQRLSAAFAVPVPVVAVFEHPTIAAQAALLGGAPGQDDRSAGRRGATRRALLLEQLAKGRQHA